MDSKSSVGGGIGVVGLLGVAFIVLKLCNVIQWSWLWVLSPFWIELIVLAIVFVVVVIVYFTREYVKNKRVRKKYDEYLEKKTKQDEQK